MTDAAKEARRAYEKEWRAKNPDKVRERNRRYWEKKARMMQRSEEDGSSNTESDTSC